MDLSATTLNWPLRFVNVPNLILEGLPDHSAREAFSRILDQNFSVVAPAGVGKTTAIAQRMGTWLASPQAKTGGQLVVVTYTQKAAAEMKDRVQRLLEADASPMGPSSPALQSLDAVFLGTLHGFCLHLIQQWGPQFGLPLGLTVCTAEEELWQAFTQQAFPEGSEDPFSPLLDVLPHLFPLSLRELVAESPWRPLESESAKGAFEWLTQALWSPPGQGEALHGPAAPLPPPFLQRLHKHALAAQSLLQFTPKGAAATAIQKAQKSLQEWLQRLSPSAPYPETWAPLPVYQGQQAAFREEWSAALGPCMDLLATTLSEGLLHLKEAYLRFRLRQGVLLYDDILYLAWLLLQNPAAHALLQTQGYRIILDEAQDTDALQFGVLLGLSSPSPFFNLEEACPKPGFFCMVGDPQQSIFSSRADLPTYLRLHQSLCRRGHTQPLVLSVTFRCPQAIVHHLNTCFPAILRGQEGQAHFVPLQEGPQAHEGTCARHLLQLQPHFQAQRSAQEGARQEAQALALWIQEQGLKGFGIEDWSQLALLCPRNDWMVALSQTLQTEGGLRCQVHQKGHASSRLQLCFSAVLRVCSDPYDAFEITFLLNEIFGFTQADLAHYVWARYSQHPHKKGLLQALRGEFWPEQPPRSRSTEPPQTGTSPPAFHPDPFALLAQPGFASAGMHPLRLLGPGETPDPHPISQALKQLGQWRTQLLQVPPAPAAQTLWQFLQPILQERYADADQGEGLSSQAHRLMDQAAWAQAQGQSVWEWMHQASNPALNADFEAPAAPQPVQAGQLQLFTCHKAKGLEWEVVLLPFLFRPLREPAPRYPRFLPDPKNPTQRGLQINAHHRCSAALLAYQLRQKQEKERLLYVACTRARRRLIYVDDSACFLDPQGSFADTLGILPGGPNHATWEALSYL